jgi:hypothetical protein
MILRDHNHHITYLVKFSQSVGLEGVEAEKKIPESRWYIADTTNDQEKNAG